MEPTKFEIRVVLKHYWKQDYEAAATAERIYEVKGEVIVSKHVEQRWFQSFNIGKENTKDLSCSGRPKLWYIIYIYTQSFGRKSTKQYSLAVRRTWCIKIYQTLPD